ncbi:MAG: S41 family peptidase [Terracidiphilus sp.]
MRLTVSFVSLACACSLLICGVHGQSVPPASKQDSEQAKPAGSKDVFDFEGDAAGSAPAGWWGGPAGTVQVDGGVAHAGQRSARIEPKAEGEKSFSTLTKTLPMDFAGSSIEWRGFLKTEDVSGFAELWMREDMDGAPAEFDNMQRRNIKGTTDWTEYSITLPVHAGAQRLVVGALVSGTGKAWVDDLELLVDGKPISQAPKVEVAKSVLDSDHQFDAGSGIAISDLTPVQIDNLALLGKVWGFLKYNQQGVTRGKLHWDYELFRVMPAVLAAPDRVAVRVVLLQWISRLGPAFACSYCAHLDLGDLELRPDLAWLGDEVLLGKELGSTLLSIQENRAPDGKQFYVSLAPGVGNPSFEHELSYGNIKYPDAGFQILALYRLWNIIEYWAPNRDIVGEDWNGVLREFLPRIALAKTSEEYQRELMALIAMVHDTHANLWSSLSVRPPAGECRLPVNMRFVGASAVVAGFTSADGGAKSGFKAGDVVTDLDGQPVDKLIASWTPYYADSNEAARLRDIARAMTNGACGPVTVGVRRGNDAVAVPAQRLPATSMTVSSTHDLPGDTFRLLSPDVAYLKLSSVKAAEVDHYLSLAAKTKGLIIDIRNYPSEFVAYSLGAHLVDKSTQFAKFTHGDLSNPGAFHWESPVSLKPSDPHYEGKVVVLVDEVSQSQAEFTTMAFRSSPQTVVVGSTTAGADGNVSTIPLPGGFSSQISGLGVSYPDGRPTQQIGIVPDKTVRPTIEGIREGRDEVLEEGVRQILGADAAADVVQKIAKP